MLRRIRLALAVASAIALASCQPAPMKVHPALWEVTAPGGQRGWLFGTVHALPRPADWRSPTINSALTNSDRLLLEIHEVTDPQAVARIFRRLATSPGQPPIEARVPPALRPRLDTLIAREHIDRSQFATMETWAAALTLARASAPEDKGGYGLDAAVIAAAPDKPVAELEGATRQLEIFDQLPERDQRDLLTLTIQSGDSDNDSPVAAWARGDLAAIERATHADILSDPELRAALLINRNRAWAAKVAAMLRSGAHPFVAVGAAHMVGSDGLPALLAAQGFTVRRVQ